MKGTLSRSTIGGFFGLGEEQKQRSTFTFDAGHPEVFGSEDNATTRFTGGTGKFATIRGVVTDVVKFDTDPDNGYNDGVERGEYWFD